MPQPYYELIRRWYAGCGMEGDMLELISIVSDIASAYHAGELSDDEMRGMVSQLCQAITAQMAQCGKSLSQEDCESRLEDAIKKSVPKDALHMMAASIRERLRGARGRGRRSGTGVSLLP